MIYGGSSSVDKLKNAESWKVIMEATRNDTELTPNVKLEDAEATKLFRRSMVLKRETTDKDKNKEVIFYKRLTPPPDGWNIFEDVIYNWKESSMGNDFNLYGSEEDLDKGRNAWKFCNYGEGVGAFRDCGPEHAVHNRWYARQISAKSTNVIQSVSFSVLK